MANLSIEEPYALMRARTGLWEPWAGNCPGPPGHDSCFRKRVSRGWVIEQCHALTSFWNFLYVPASSEAPARRRKH
jgi:hypothetical protein